MKKFGFTLAEVLITLGIIGVVAAMTIPSLSQNITKKKFSSLLKQDYAILSQVVLQVTDAGGLASMTKNNDMNEMKNAFNTFFLPYLKTISVCYDEAGCWSDTITTYLNGGNVKYFRNGRPGEKVVCFTLSNGTFVCLDDYPDKELWSEFGIKDTTPFELAVFLDLNGKSKPNVMGRDVFTFIILSDGTLIPAGRDKTEAEQAKDCSKGGKGLWCPSYLKSKNWDFNAIKYY